MALTRAPLLAALLAAPGAAVAETTGDFQLWTAVLGTAELAPETPGVSLWLDVHVRRGDAATVHLLRPGVGVRWAPWISAWVGYAWVPSFRDEAGDVVSEHRLWQQVVLERAFEGGLKLQSRTRLEQRFSDAGTDVGLRLRQLVRVSWQPADDLPLGVALWDELFVGFADTDFGARGGFDQNRAFVGPFAQISPHARLEMGYLFAYVARDAGDLAAQVLATNLVVTLR